MTNAEITIEVQNRHHGARTNKCLMGCGRRTSSRTMTHMDCYCDAPREEQIRVYRQQHATLVDAIYFGN